MTEAPREMQVSVPLSELIALQERELSARVKMRELERYREDMVKLVGDLTAVTGEYCQEFSCDELGTSGVRSVVKDARRLRAEVARLQSELVEARNGASSAQRWENAFRTLATFPVGPHEPFDINQIIEMVRRLAKCDGNGDPVIPGSERAFVSVSKLNTLAIERHDLADKLRATEKRMDEREALVHALFRKDIDRFIPEDIHPLLFAVATRLGFSTGDHTAEFVGPSLFWQLVRRSIAAVAERDRAVGLLDEYAVGHAKMSEQVSRSRNELDAALTRAEKAESRASVPVVTLHTTKEVRERVLGGHARYHSAGLVVGVVPKEEVDRYNDLCFEFAAVLAADCNTLENALEKLSGTSVRQTQETSKA